MTTEAFLVTKSFWAFGVAIVVHLFGDLGPPARAAFLDLWLMRSAAPRVCETTALALQLRRP